MKLGRPRKVYDTLGCDEEKKVSKPVYKITNVSNNEIPVRIMKSGWENITLHINESVISKRIDRGMGDLEDKNLIKIEKVEE